MNKPVIYTIGHSNHTIEVFIDLVRSHSVNCIIDVRSLAASAYSPHFNKEPLGDTLKENRITYMHFAEEFGARHTDPDLLDDDGKVNFELVRRSWNFKTGLERLWQGIEKGFVIALMCSESEPFDCHRFSMISIALEKEGLEVRHILKDKTLRTNADLEEQLLKKYEKKIPQPDMFQPNITKADQIKAAYRLRNKDIAFSARSKLPKEENYD